MKNILVSACLMGVECRYDGKCQNIPEFDEKIDGLMERYNLIPVCPEIMGGMSTPRKPSEIKGDKVVNNEGEDVTRYFERGSGQVLRLARLYKCEAAILKKRSPSCGSGYIYDGTFSKTLIHGDGKTAKLLKKHGIMVVGEDETDKLYNIKEGCNEW